MCVCTVGRKREMASGPQTDQRHSAAHQRRKRPPFRFSSVHKRLTDHTVQHHSIWESQHSTHTPKQTVCFFAELIKSIILLLFEHRLFHQQCWGPPVEAAAATTVAESAKNSKIGVSSNICTSSAHWATFFLRFCWPQQKRITAPVVVTLQAAAPQSTMATTANSSASGVPLFWQTRSGG